MEKIKINLIVDILALIDLLVLAVSGFIMWLAIPRRSSMEVAGLGKHGWLVVHDWAAVIFVGLMLLHLILHWHYVKNFAKILWNKKQQDDKKI